MPAIFSGPSLASFGPPIGERGNITAARTESECCDAKGLLVVADDVLRVLHVDRMLRKPRVSLRSTSVAHVDLGLHPSFQPESHGRLVANAGLSRAGCGATEFVSDNLVIDPPSVDLLAEQLFPYVVLAWRVLILDFFLIASLSLDRRVDKNAGLSRA